MSISQVIPFVELQGGKDMPLVISSTDESSQEATAQPTPRVVKDDPPKRKRGKKNGWVLGGYRAGLGVGDAFHVNICMLWVFQCF